MKRIRSLSLYPNEYGRLLPGEPPPGCAMARRNECGRQVIKDEWPEVAIGEEIEIETTNHYIWKTSVVEIRNAKAWVVRVISKEPLPLPPIVEGKPYILPYMAGDAWCTRPEKGKILVIGGQHYKVTHKPRSVTGGYEYQLAPVSADAYAKRPGRVSITDLTDPSPSSYNYYGYNVGRIIAINGEWLHVEKVSREAYGSGDGSEVFGYNIFGVGHFIPTGKAKKLSAAWASRQKVRSVELSLRVAQNDVDYGGDPGAVSGLKAELVAARKEAGLVGE